MGTINVSTLLPALRLRLGDTDPATYRYLDLWLTTALIQAVKKLGKWWYFKYLVTDAGDVSRNTGTNQFSFDEATYGVIEDQDETIIVLMAAILTLEGSLENSAWSAVSWRDAEIAYSNLEQFRTRDGTINRLINELYDMLKPPTKRLAWTIGYPLPGFQDNEYENKTKP